MVNHTTVRSFTSSPWLLDLGASHHVTFDPRNILDSTSYDGPDEIIIGNGKGLNITRIGSSSLPSSLTSPFILRDVLCIPSISRNIISIAKFNKQNSTSIELFPDFFLIKDLTTGKVLLRGPNEDDTYEWPCLLPISLPRKQAMMGVKNSSNLWHRRLGHPNH